MPRSATRGATRRALEPLAARATSFLNRASQVRALPGRPAHGWLATRALRYPVESRDLGLTSVICL